ncbi:hypothetical protein NHQ30_005120 [Ciborinia camelliae]|nr:hypothetical protein NHQ30_005120 [Ciborinia camelliae]
MCFIETMYLCGHYKKTDSRGEPIVKFCVNLYFPKPEARICDQCKGKYENREELAKVILSRLTKIKARELAVDKFPMSERLAREYYVNNLKFVVAETVKQISGQDYSTRVLQALPEDERKKWWEAAQEYENTDQMDALADKMLDQYVGDPLGSMSEY